MTFVKHKIHRSWNSKQVKNYNTLFSDNLLHILNEICLQCFRMDAKFEHIFHVLIKNCLSRCGMPEVDVHVSLLKAFICSYWCTFNEIFI